MKLENCLKSCDAAGMTTDVVDAPKDAVLFDKMIVAFSNPSRKTIKMVILYDTRTEKVLGSY